MLVVTIKRRLLLLRERPQESVDGRRALLCHELRLRYFCDVSRVVILTIPPGTGSCYHSRFPEEKAQVTPYTKQAILLPGPWYLVFRFPHFPHVP